MVINDFSSIVEFLNSDLVSGIANASQFYNIYQSTKAGTYAQLNHDLDKQTHEIESKLDQQTIDIVQKLIQEIKSNSKQNEIIIKQNEDILSLLRSR